MARGKQFLKERLHELLEVLHTVRAHVPDQSGLASVRASSQALVFWLAFVFSRLLLMASETTKHFRNRARAPRRLSNIASGQVMWSQGTIPSAWTDNGLFRSTDFSISRTYLFHTSAILCSGICRNGSETASYSAWPRRRQAVSEHIRDLIHERASASEPMCAADSSIRIATWRWRSKRRLACRCAAELFCCG